MCVFVCVCVCVASFSCHCLQLLFAGKREFRERAARLLTLRDSTNSSNTSSADDERSDEKDEVAVLAQHHTVQDLSREEILCLQW